MTTGQPPENLGTTAQLAAQLDAELVGPGDLTIDRLDALDAGGPNVLSFIRDAKHAARWAESTAAAALVSEGIEVPGHDDRARALLVVKDADIALISLLEVICAGQTQQPEPGVHGSAVIAASASVAASASIGPHCVVDESAGIGEGTALGPRVSIGRGVVVGRACVLHAGVTLQPGTAIGDGCTLHPGVVIGADGFGYRPAPDGRGVVKIPHVGGVRIGSGVEIGANSTIDRGKFGDTTIGDGAKIDNLVQIGHNCRIGRAAVICGQAAIGGSTTVGDGTMIDGAAMIPDNVDIEPRSLIGGGAQVVGNVKATGEFWFGLPARPASEMRRRLAATTQVENLRNRVRDLRARVAELEARSGGADA